jgi:hypothetical protein
MRGYREKIYILKLLLQYHQYFYKDFDGKNQTISKNITKNNSSRSHFSQKKQRDILHICAINMIHLNNCL